VCPCRTDPRDRKRFPLTPQTLITTTSKCQQLWTSKLLGAMIHRTSLIYRNSALMRSTLGRRTMQHILPFTARDFQQALISLWGHFHPYSTLDRTSVTVFCRCTSQARTQQETFDQMNVPYSVGSTFIAHILSLKSLSSKCVPLWIRIAFHWNNSH